MDRLVSEVIAVAQRDLMPGDVLDGIGGRADYRLIDTYAQAKAECLLPAELEKQVDLLAND